MKLSKKTKVTALVIIIVVLVTAVIFATMQVMDGKKANIIKILPDEADVRIQDFIYTEVGHDNMRWEIKAKSAQYQKKRNLALFDQVQIKLTTKAGKVFVMTGDQGEMLTDKKDLEIKGHVVITSDAGDKFSTDYLRYSDARKHITTDAPVLMENKQMKIRGVGLSIFTDKGELTLSSDVRARIN